MTTRQTMKLAVCQHEWHSPEMAWDCAKARRIMLGHEAAVEAVGLASDLRYVARQREIRSCRLTAEPPRGHAAHPAYELAHSPFLAWVPTVQHIGPHGATESRTAADVVLSANCATYDPRTASRPLVRADSVQSWPLATWLAWQAAHRSLTASRAALKRSYGALWARLLGVKRARPGRPTKTVAADAAPVLAETSTVAAAVAAALAGSGRWPLASGLSLTADGTAWSLGLHGLPALKTRERPGTTKAATVWIERTTAAWQAARAAVLTAAADADGLGSATVDVG